MNQTEFMDLLRYYFRRISKAELQDILSDYESHFKEGKARGLTEEEICRELGSPKAVYEMYLHEGMIHEKEGVPLPDAAQLAGAAGKIAGTAGRIAGAAAGKAQAAWERSGKDVPGRRASSSSCSPFSSPTSSPARSSRRSPRRRSSSSPARASSPGWRSSSRAARSAAAPRRPSRKTPEIPKNSLNRQSRMRQILRPKRLRPRKRPR